jgi:hypothetical protein
MQIILRFRSLLDVQAEGMVGDERASTIRLKP